MCGDRARDKNRLFVCKELALVIIQAGKLQNLLSESVSQRPRRANGVVLVCMLAGPSLQEELMFQFEFEGRKKPPAQLEDRLRGRISSYPQEVRLFILVRPSPGWMTPTTLGRAICFTRSTDSDVNLTQKHLE